MDDRKLRAWWSQRQGLDGSLDGARPGEVLERTGWSRSVGGAGPYLTLFSRAGTSREEADAAAATLDIYELPSARGCTYILPANDFALGLKVGESFGEAEMKVAAKLGVTNDEVEKLCAAVVKALAKEPLDPNGIREATGRASRSLGEEGKKKGLTTTLPLALGRLQARGEIRRVPTNGRLESQRYRYALWKPNPLAKYKVSTAEAYTELARRFFQWVGPATMAEFQWFSGLGVKVSKDAVGPLGLVPAEDGSDRLLLPEDADAYRKFKVPDKPRYALVSLLDPIAANRRNAASLLDAADQKRAAFKDASKAAGSSIADLPNHAILDRGRVIGLWEYDVDTQAIAWASFVPKDKALEAAVKRTEAFVRDQLGDAPQFSLDSPKSRAPRIAALRKLG